MTLEMIPDVERITYAYLDTHPDIAALGTRFVGRTPKDTGSPWVRVTQLDAADNPGSSVERLISYMVQLDIYAGGRPEVWPHALTIRAALKEMPGIHDAVVVTAVRFAGMARIPDQDFEPARERVVLTAVIYAHS